MAGRSRTRGRTITHSWQDDHALQDACRHPAWTQFHRSCREGADVHFATSCVRPGTYRAEALRYVKKHDYYAETVIATAEAATPIAATLAAFDLVDGLDPSWAAGLREDRTAPAVEDPPEVAVVEPVPLDTTIADLLGDPIAELIG